MQSQENNPIYWYLGVWRQYVNFNGRARRKEYWYFVLMNVIALVVLSILDGMTGTFSPELGLGPLSGLYMLAVFLPGLAVLVRRLHDSDKSGWWALLGLIPFAGPIALIVLAVLDGTGGENRFGPDPKAAALNLDKRLGA